MNTSGINKTSPIWTKSISSQLSDNLLNISKSSLSTNISVSLSQKTNTSKKIKQSATLKITKSWASDTVSNLSGSSSNVSGTTETRIFNSSKVLKTFNLTAPNSNRHNLSSTTVYLEFFVKHLPHSNKTISYYVHRKVLNCEI